jgi:hypothetical protein
MPRKSSIKSDILQEYGDAAATALRYGIEKDKLKKMRLLGIGPEYRTAGPQDRSLFLAFSRKMVGVAAERWRKR